ncbi:hypothetical protein [Psychroflexus halocasei]|uniref:CDP-Glycerol:Poly(Glycerophosphate) glycerophosphotransferase n=1 Tax=Psychroflexus halocasei TaxID=908615 RepID=A0A1H4C3I1_9FLAO|nr:hypothetical protein [Psychroflexus halocasei]SEA54961.1 hypothetical protein SAMN05421540_10730 [Psychroflexus halocasei]
MIKNNNLLVLMPDGIGVRNYLHTNLLKIDKFEISILNKFKSDSLNNLNRNDSIKFLKLKPYRESIASKFYRETIHLSRLRYNSNINNNKTILINFKVKGSSFSKMLFYKFVILYSRKKYKYQQIQELEKKYEKHIRKSDVYKYYYEYFKANRPSKLFCTHQRAVIAAPIFAAAKDANIKTATAIYSWDNLPKARLALRADDYIVWSPYMKKELKTYYPEIKDEQIEVLGTPQFQFHYDNTLFWSRSKLAAYYNLDSDKKWLCFSGDDKTTSPFDPDYLQDIAHVISNSNLINDWQILLRPVPVEGFQKYQHVIDQFPDLIKKAGAAWSLSSEWTDAYPEKEDLAILSNICEHSEAVINVGSTMALDFGMHHKPAIYINYEADSSSHWSIKRIYKFQHFRTMNGLEPVIWLYEKEELFEILTNLKKYHQKTKADMQQWCERIIPEKFRVESSKLINQFLYK